MQRGVRDTVETVIDRGQKKKERLEVTRKFFGHNETFNMKDLRKSEGEKRKE